MKLLLFIFYFVFFLKAGSTLLNNNKPKQSFLALKINENFEDDFGDMKSENKTHKEKGNIDKNNDKEKDGLNSDSDEIYKNVSKGKINTNDSKVNEDKNKDKKSDDKLKSIKNEQIIKSESDNLIKKLNPNFLNELLKLQNNPVLLNISNLINNNTSKQKVNNLISNELKKDQYVKIISKNEVLDNSKINYLDNLLHTMVNDIDKKSLQNSNFITKNNNLEKSYDSTNNQIMIFQSKLESILQEMKYITEVKNSLINQNSLIKESTVSLNNSDEALKKNVDNLEDKIVKLDSLNEKIGKKVKNFEKEQKFLVNKNIKKVVILLKKAREFEDLKIKYEKAGDSKDKLVKSIHNSFDKFDNQELKFLDIKEKENELDLSLKKEENTEKLLSLEIEHLKASNMIEIQKVEEMKQEIEKSKTMKENLLREIDELEDKLRSIENETKETQMEYEIKKNEYEDGLNKAKKDINLLRKKKNAMINNNKIIPLDNLKKKKITKAVVAKSPIKDEAINFLEKNNKEVKDKNDGNDINVEKNLDELLKKNGINSMKDLEDKLNKFKSENEGKIDSKDEDSALKSQILSLINTLKN